MIQTPFGFDPKIFLILKRNLDELPEYARDTLIAVDEVRTRKGLLLDSKTMNYKGLEDFGDGAINTNIREQADHGLVLLLQPLAADFVQTSAVSASKGPTNGLTLERILIEAIVILEQAGARIHEIVSDGASPSRKFWSTMGCSGKRENLNNWFCHPTEPDKKVFLFSDTPHLIKNVRNRLFGKGELRVSTF